MRTFIDSWKELEEVQCENDRMSILVFDRLHNQMKLMDVTIYEVLYEKDDNKLFKEEMNRLGRGV